MKVDKYNKKTIPQLIKLATKHFNKFIRDRDQGKGCISCGRPFTQAGHFYSAGHHSALRFNEKNVNGQCVRCNMYLSGNLNEYRKNLIKRIGGEEVLGLDLLVDYYKRIGYKWDRYSLIKIIQDYGKN